MEEQNQKQVIAGLAAQFKEVFEGSHQAMYAYLDDGHKVCNEKFASLLGYSSPEEWAQVAESFPTAFVAEQSQSVLVHAFQHAMEEKIASHIEVTWKKKDGGEVATKVILVPVAFQEELLAIHFVEQL